MNKAWNDNDSLIAAYPLDMGYLEEPCPKSHKASCEICGCLVGALPQSIAKSKLEGWHLICIRCVNKVRAENNDLQFAGRYVTEEQAKKVLP